MEGIGIILVLMGIGALICGPVALIIAIVSLTKANRLDEDQQWLARRLGAMSQIHPGTEEAGAPKKAASAPEHEKPKPIDVLKPVEPPKPAQTPRPTPTPRPSVTPQPAPIWESPRPAGTMPEPVMPPPAAYSHKPVKAASQYQALEEQIGTKWVLIAGVLTVLVGMGFFLKYAYDNGFVGPVGRTIIAAISGLTCLGVGEVTRRKGYGIVAKGVTAMGFGLLYVTVFAACKYANLIEPAPAFVIAIMVTAAAMLYAVSLDEILIAILSLIGGFLCPVILSTGQNAANALFAYLTVLGGGAMLCAYYRKWRGVNLLALAGTWVLYGGWFEQFYTSPQNATATHPSQFLVAMVWCGVFFAMYIALPVMHELVRRVKAQREDVLLLVADSFVTFVFLWRILFTDYRWGLAAAAVAIAVCHMALLAAITNRCRQDTQLRLTVLTIGIFFLTLAVPLYLKMHAVAMAWGAEAMILTLIGLRYGSKWTLGTGVIAAVLAVGDLFYTMPLHTVAFRFLYNGSFASWCFVAAALLAADIIYRRTDKLERKYADVMSQVYWIAAMGVILLGVLLEWRDNCYLNLVSSSQFNTIRLQAEYPQWSASVQQYGSGYDWRYLYQGLFTTRGYAIIFAAAVVLASLRPARPKGMLGDILAGLLAVVGALFAIAAFDEYHTTCFGIFANRGFAVAAIFAAAVAMAAYLMNRDKTEEFACAIGKIMALALVALICVLITREIYSYWNGRSHSQPSIENWQFLAMMYISVAWAVYAFVLTAAGFWKSVKALRYMGLGLFGLLLLKVFIIDTSNVKNVYRIAAFMATGISLVLVSYLYQHLNKKGFFVNLRNQIDKNAD